VAKEYSNRTDLQNPTKKVARQAAKGQAYGKAGEQMSSQRAVPVAPSPTTVAPRRPAVAPGSMGAFDRPTEAPDEPLTAGVDFGPGMGSRAAGIPPTMGLGDPVLQELLALYRSYPNDDLANLISAMVERG
jgi:hypothetical protein